MVRIHSFDEVVQHSRETGSPEGRGAILEHATPLYQLCYDVLAPMQGEEGQGEGRQRGQSAGGGALPGFVTAAGDVQSC